MRSCIPVISIFIFTLLLGIAELQAKDSWYHLKSKDGNFSILMPEKPKVSHKSTQSAVGNIPEELFEVVTKDLTATAEFSKLPGIAVFFGGKKTILKKAAAALIKSEKGKITSSKDLKIQGKPAKEIHFKARDKGTKKVCIAQLILDKKIKILYVLITKSPESKPDTAGMQKFLNSFKLGH